MSEGNKSILCRSLICIANDFRENELGADSDHGTYRG